MTNRTLPRHARSGLLAIGWRKARPGETEDQPIWPILGGSPGDDEDETDEDEDPDGDPDGDESDEDGDPDGADDLGDKGKRALDAMKARLRTERERRKAAETENATLKAKPPEGGGAPDEQAIREQARTEARAEALRERALDKLEAKAARLLADPEDARAYLGSRVEDFIDGDGIDIEAITEALEELIERKPYLAATAAGTKPRFEGTGDGGARKGSTGPRQLTETDVKKMTPEQIDEAHRKGQLRDYLGG
jgi:hypothetical protein